MSREWKEVKLGDVAEIKGGKRLPKGTNLIKEQNLHPYIKVKDMNGGKYIKLNDNFEFVDAETHKKIARYIVGEGDLIISIVGTIGLVSKVHKSLNNANLTENCVKIINLRNVESDYLYYILTSRHGQNEMMKGTVGSTQPKLPIYNIEKIEFPLPPLNEQKAIAHILSTLDEKIETNNQINKTLEKMAHTIFKHWFADFEFPNENGEPYKSSGGEMMESELGMIPKGWEAGELEDIAIITMGQSPKGSSYNEHGDGTVFYQGCTDFMNRFPVRRLYTTEPKRIARDGDILMSVRAPVGDINIANEECCIGRGLCSFRSKDNIDSYLLYTLLNLKEQFNIFNGEGTVFGSINQKDLKAIKVIMPNNSIITNFNDIATSLDKKYLCLEKESRILIQLRDLLLPKLMSGELRVPIKEGDIS